MSRRRSQVRDGYVARHARLDEPPLPRPRRRWTRASSSRSVAVLGVSEPVPNQSALCIAGLAAVAAPQAQPILAQRLWRRSVEAWEDEPGSRLLLHERLHHEQALPIVPLDADDVLTIEEAVRLAWARVVSHSPGARGCRGDRSAIASWPCGGRSSSSLCSRF